MADPPWVPCVCRWLQYVCILRGQKRASDSNMCVWQLQKYGLLPQDAPAQVRECAIHAGDVGSFVRAQQFDVARWLAVDLTINCLVSAVRSSTN